MVWNWLIKSIEFYIEKNIQRFYKSKTFGLVTIFRKSFHCICKII